MIDVLEAQGLQPLGFQSATTEEARVSIFAGVGARV
jgi:hypothetical protein